MSKKILNLALVAALAPKEETFSAELVNEGVWVTEAHLQGIENQLSSNAAAIKKAGEDLTAANTAKEQAEAAAKTAKETVAARDAEIVTLKAEVEKLKKEPAGSITETTVDADKNAGKKNKADKYMTSIDRQAAEYFDQ